MLRYFDGGGEIGAIIFAAIEEKTAGSVSGSETDLSKELSESGSGCEADLHEELGGGQVWRHHPVGIGHAPVFQQTKFCLVGSGNEVSGKIRSPCVLGENGHDVDTLGNLVLDGVFTVLSEVDQGSSGSGSCTVPSIEAAHVLHGCSSSMIASTGCGRNETDMKVVQLWARVDRCSQFSPLRDVGCALPEL